MQITKQRLRQIIKEELVNMNDLLAPGLGKDVRFTTVESRDDAMRGAERPGADIENMAEPEDEETRDRAFDSPEGRLVTLINAREQLNKMTRDELEDLSLSLDADMVATLRHILANPMYAPMEENITPGVQQLMKHHPHAAAKIKELAGNGYRASEIKRMLQLR